MKRKQIIRNLKYQPTKLLNYQIDHPLRVMTYFFADFPIHETRDNLWELYQGWIYHSAGYASDQTTKDMLDFYTQFREFIEASYVYTHLNNRT